VSCCSELRINESTPHAAGQANQPKKIPVQDRDFLFTGGFGLIENVTQAELHVISRSNTAIVSE
jgi:hypothetical protein